MQNKLYRFLKERNMVSAGDRVICALSGGADSVALLFALYLLKDKLEIQLEAAHFNHHLRGAESDRDAEFVKELCDRYDIPLHLGGGEVKPGKKRTGGRGPGCPVWLSEVLARENRHRPHRR